MSFLDFKYGHSTVRQRLSLATGIGLQLGPFGWCLRLAFWWLMVRTCMDPTESIYMGPFAWVAFWLFLFFIVY